MCDDTTCPDCDKEFRCKADLAKHRTKKYKCNEGNFPCRLCNKRFRHQPARCTHEKTCKGPKVNKKTALLLKRIQDLEQQQRDNAVEASTSEEASPIEIQPVGVAHIADCIKPQVYFGVPGPLLKPVEPVADNKTLIKIGSSDSYPRRHTEHSADFGSFQLLDSIVTNNPKYVENKLKDYLKVKHPMIKCKSTNKKYTDTEIIVIETQAEYEQIIMVAKKLADDYASEVEAASTQRVAMNNESIAHELESLRLKLRIAELESQSAAAGV